MGKLVSLLTTKGGSGKSTLALLLAHAKPFSGVRCAIVEADAQGSLSRWGAERAEAGLPERVPVLARYEPGELVDGRGRIANGFQTILDAHDVVFLDLPGESRAGTRTRAAMLYSDLVLIPVRLTEFDLDSVAAHVLPAIRELVEAGGDAAAFRLVVTMGHPSANPSRLIGDLEGVEARPLEVVLPWRKAFASFSAGGHTLAEYVQQANSGDKRQAVKARRDADAVAQAVAAEVGL